MSERVHLKVLYFYILWHFTLTRGLGVTKGVLEGRGSTHLVIYYYIPMGEFGSKHIYLISDLNNDLSNDVIVYLL